MRFFCFGGLMTGKNRNQPCYCGSGIKYKKCHLLVEEQALKIKKSESKNIEIYELQRIFKETLDLEICIASHLNKKHECSKEIINAHTLAKSLSLQKIASDGHVYAFKNKDLYEVFNNNGFSPLKKLGIRTASTFKGFCSFHDNYLFSSIEKQNFMLDKKQILSLFYRGFALEYYKKKTVLSNAKNIFKPLLESFDSSNLEMGALHLISNWKRAKMDFDDLVKLNEYLVEAWDHKEFKKLETYAIQITDEIPFVCTGLFAIYQDLNGKILQDIYNYDTPSLEYTSLNVFYAKDGSSWIVWSWLKKNNSINNIIVEQLKEYSITDQIGIIANFMILYTENTYFSIKYIDSLSSASKQKIEKTYNGTLSGNFLIPTDIILKIEVNNSKVIEI